MIQCKGCHSISFRHISSNSENCDPYTGEPYEAIFFYPPRNKDTLPLKWYRSVPEIVGTIYRETISAYNSGLYMLCAGGLRATIESICKDNNIIDGEVTTRGKTSRKDNLEGKINGLLEQGIITSKQTKCLHEHRFLGNGALHDLELPRKKDLSTAIQILENILDSLYEVEDMARDLELSRTLKEYKKSKKNKPL
jgi:hypothetical protein